MADPSRHRRTPIPKKDDANEIARFMETSAIVYDTSHRLTRFGLWERARLYFQDEQYLEPDYTEDATRTPFWKPLQVDVDDWQPMPVQNEMVAPIRNESARLVGVGSRPYIRVEKDDPAASRASKVSKDVLLDRLEKLRWFEKDYEGTHSLVLYGTWIIKSFLEIDYTKPQRIPIKTAKRCPECGFKVASPRVRGKRMEQIDASRPGVMVDQTEPTNPLEEPVVSATITHCLTCPPSQVPVEVPALVEDPETGEMIEQGTEIQMHEGPGPALEGYIPSDEEARNETDHFGDPLGEDIALVDTGLRNVSVYDAFPENSGIDIEVGEMAEFAESHIESLDWIRAHYKNGDQVKAEDGLEMLRWHPVVGGSQHYYGAGGAADPTLFDHHARVKEWHKLPWIEDGKLNKGRSIVMAGNVVLLDADYMIESKNNPGELIPRVQYEYIYWEPRDREVWGISASEWMFSAQDNINTERAQAQYARHIFGNPKIIAADGTDLTYAGWADSGYSSDIWYYRAGPKGEKPDFFHGMQLGSEWKLEQDTDLNSIQRRIGTMEIEVGDVENTGITAASALMYVGEKAAEGRKPRIQRIREAKKRIYRHQLMLMHEFYREPRYYHVKDRNDKWAIKSFVGTDLMGQTNVMLEDEAVYDVRMFRREAIKEGMEVGTITADTAAAKARINKILGIPNDINDEENIQVEDAEEEWFAFVDEDVEPYVDERLESHLIHYQQHASAMLSDKAKELKAACNWGLVKMALWGWETEFDMLEEQERQLLMNPPSDQPPQPVPNELTGQVDPAAEAAALQQWQQQWQMKAAIDAMPKATELRLIQFWTNKLLQAGIDVNGVQRQMETQDPMQLRRAALMETEESEEDEKMRIVRKLLRFEAHLETHYRLSKKQARAAMGGEPQPAVPGGPETETGMLPAPSAMDAMSQAPGAGPGAVTASGQGV